MENLIDASLWCLSIFAWKYFFFASKLKTNSKNLVSISKLWIYPIKSCMGIQLEKSTVNSRGLLYDRMFMLIDGNNDFVTQKKYVKLCQVSTTIDFSLKVMLIAAPSMDSISVPLEEALNPNSITITMWKEAIVVHEMDLKISQWFQNYLGVSDVKLVRMPDNTHRQCDKAYAVNGGNIGFADDFPFLIISENSLNHLNKKLYEYTSCTPSSSSSECRNSIDMAQIRPNIVLSSSSWDSASEGVYIEDQMSVCRVNKLTLTNVKPCMRCIVPNVDVSTGIVQPGLPVSNLQLSNDKWRKECFYGCYYNHEFGEGEICVGEEVILG